MEELHVYEIKVGVPGGLLHDKIRVVAADYGNAGAKAKKYCETEDFAEKPDILSVEYLFTLTEV